MSAATKRKVATKDLVVGLGATGLSIARYLRRAGLDAKFVDSATSRPAWMNSRKFGPTLTYRWARRRCRTISVASSFRRASPTTNSSSRKRAKPTRSRIRYRTIRTRCRSAVCGDNRLERQEHGNDVAVPHGLCGRKQTLAGGNLGEPALDLLDREVPDFYVLELSSFQLLRTESLAPAVAVLLNVTPDHLDWHRSAKEYRDSKYSVYQGLQRRLSIAPINVPRKKRKTSKPLSASAWTSRRRASTAFATTTA